MQDDAAFVAAWKGCSAATAVRHLDVEAPALFQELYQKELRGEWKGEQVKCIVCRLPSFPGQGLLFIMHACRVSEFALFCTPHSPLCLGLCLPDT